MKAAFYSFKNKKFFVREMPVPKINKGEILVKIKTSALCGTDLHIMAGELNDKLYDKKEIILGHEWSGIVMAAGNRVSKFKKGDRVFGLPHIPCGQCLNCQEGHENWCDKPVVLGLNRPGCHAEYLVVPEAALFCLPENLDFQTGVLLSDTVSTAFHAIGRVGLKPKERILILGLGPVGLTIGIMSRILGVKEIYAMEIEKYRFNLARRLFRAKKASAANFAGLRRTFSRVFETTGSADALEYGFQALERGGELALVGVHNKKYSLDTLRFMYRELALLGCFGYTAKEASEFTKLSSVKNNKERFRKIITRRYPLKDINLAHRVFKGKKCGKVVLFIN